MVAADSQTMAAAQPEINPPAVTAGHHNPKNHHTDHDHNHDSSGVDYSYVFTSLGRQSSIYSLTLDEFQHKLSDNGKSFGSMNMDEFLSSIWTAEENQAHHHSHNHENPNSVQVQMPSVSFAGSEISKGTIAKQMSLPRQGSLTLPAPLCRKTVDEVWTEIQRTQQSDDEQQKRRQQTVGDSSSTQRQPTFGEMTLEDFLMKAGVVREQCGSGLPNLSVAAHHHYGFGDPQMGPTLLTRPVIGVGTGGGYQSMSATTGESSGNAKRNNGYLTQVVGYGGRMNNGGAPRGGFAPGAGLSPVSPVSSEGICGPGQVDNAGGQYGQDIRGLRGRKRIIDGPVEKVVERRQRRMIKNRESAARSRARKQAYTVELEAELNQLREENAQLKQAVNYEDQNLKLVLMRAQRAQDKLRAMRRSGSCNL